MELNSYFHRFVSLSAAASGNQTFFPGEDGPMESMVFYRFSGQFKGPVSLLFSDTIDSTFAEGLRSRAGDTLGGWKILSAKAAVVKSADPNSPVPEETLTFEGKEEKLVEPGEWFSSDPVSLKGDTEEYLRLRLIFEGRRLPCLQETLLDSYRKQGEKWVPSPDTPLAAMIGGEKKVRAKVGFLGDSITEGIGTEAGSYQGYVSLVSSLLGDEYAVWNLGIGYARAADAAQNGSFLRKAKACDAVVICFGTNDLLQTGDTERLKADLEKCLRLLCDAKVQTMLQTLPPFDYTGELETKWKDVNRFIREEIGKTIPVFDPVPLLSPDGGATGTALYGGHPNAEGCRKWAGPLYEKLLEWLAPNEKRS